MLTKCREQRAPSAIVRRHITAPLMHVPGHPACTATSSPSPSSQPRRCRHCRTWQWQPTPQSQVVMASLVLADVGRLSSAVVTDATGERLLAAVDALVLSDVRHHSSSILAIATPERLLAAVAALVASDGRCLRSSVVTDAAGVRLLAAVDALVDSDVRRMSSAMLAIATPERLLAAVDALVGSDVRRMSSAILAIATAERLLARVSALVASDVRWPVSAILAIPTPQPRHTRTVIASASQRIVAIICATRRTQTQSSQPPRIFTHTIATRVDKHTIATTALHATRHLPSSARAATCGHTRGPQFRHQRVCASVWTSWQPQPHAFVSAHASLFTSDAAVTSPDTLHSYCFTAAADTAVPTRGTHAVTTPARQRTTRRHKQKLPSHATTPCHQAVCDAHRRHRDRNTQSTRQHTCG
jgi:hypothetical protein